MKFITHPSSIKAGLPALLVFSILSAIVAGLSGCASSGGSSAGGTHEMGPPKSTSRMSNESMPGR